MQPNPTQPAAKHTCANCGHVRLGNHWCDWFDMSVRLDDEHECPEWWKEAVPTERKGEDAK